MTIYDYSVIVLMIVGVAIWLFANWLRDGKKWQSVVAVIVIVLGVLKWYFGW